MSSFHRRAVSWTRVLAAALLGAASLGAGAAPGDAEQAPAQALRATHQRLSDRLAQSSFGRPIELDSAETEGGLEGDVYAVVDHPLAEISGALKGASRWCDVMTLHINNRRCRAATSADGQETLTLYVVRRYDKPVDQAFELPFVYRVVGASPEHMSVEMSAAHGPFGTSGYKVRLEAVALDGRQSFLHFSYSYDHNMMVRLATEAYLATFGRDKVGFTVSGKARDGQPEYIRGLRGLVERNAMRYFLALDAYLAAPGPGQVEKRERQWYASAEQYPRQLHEVDLDTYLALKREDRQRDGAGR